MPISPIVFEGVQFLNEITPFDIKNYQMVVTWIHANKKPYKIYTLNANSFYLHDEKRDKLHEFNIEVNGEIFGKSDTVIKVYEFLYPLKL